MRSVAVLDRTKEPGSLGEPLFLDVVAAMNDAVADGQRELMPRVIGGRYGLSSKEFTPGMVAGVLEHLKLERPKRRFTVGINDDVSAYEPLLRPLPRYRAARNGTGRVFRPGFGRDGRRQQEHHQDPRRRGRPVRPGILRLRLEEVRLTDGFSFTLRAKPIRAPYLVAKASFVGCHQFGLLERAEVLERAGPGATLLLNCPYAPEQVWDVLTQPVQEQILAKHIDLYVIDAAGIARDAGLGGRTNTVLQTCFFAISGVLEKTQAIERVKAADQKDLRPSRQRSRRDVTTLLLTGHWRGSTAWSCRLT